MIAKRLVVAAILLNVCGFVMAQLGPKSFRLKYEYQNTGLGVRREVTLSVKGHESLSVFSGRDSLLTVSNEDSDFSLSGEDDTGRQVYRNLRTGELIFRDFYPLAGEFKPCVVNDSTASMKWTFTAKTMRIGNYMCRSATTDFRGRHYEAWYTEEIPIMFGPWKLFGLPGAIVKVESKDGIIRFLLTHLVSQQEEVIHRPSQGHAISMKEYVRIRRESINDFIATLKSKLPRGAEVTVNTTGDYNLETDFSDVKK